MRRAGIACILIAVLFVLGGCGAVPEPDREPVRVYCSFAPLCTLTGMVTDGIPEFQVSCLVRPWDEEPDTYELSSWDAYMIQNECDVLIIAGGGEESFEDRLRTDFGGGPVLIRASSGIGETENTHARHEAEPTAYLWLSLSGAEEMLENISGGLALVCPSAAGRLRSNTDEARDRISALRGEYEAFDTEKDCDVFLLNEHIRVIAGQAGLGIAGSFERDTGKDLTDPETEELIMQIGSSGAGIVLTEKQTPERILRALTEAGFLPVTIDLCQFPPEKGERWHYIDVMRSNLERIRSAFQTKEGL